MKKVLGILAALLIVCIIGVALILLWPSVEKQMVATRGIRLRFIYRPNTESRYRIRNEVEMDLSFKNVPKKNLKNFPSHQSISQDILTRMKTREVSSSGEATLDILTESIRQSFRLGDSPAREDTSNPLKGTTLTLKLLPTGKTLALTGMPAGAPGSPQIPFQQMLQMMNPVFPEKPIKIGESWSQQFDIPFQVDPVEVPMKMDITYRLIGIERVDGRQCARIGLDISTSYTIQVVGSPPAEGKGEGKGNGTIFFSLKEGQIIKSSSSMELSTNLLFKTPKPPRPTLVMKQKVTSSTELLY